MTIFKTAAVALMAMILANICDAQQIYSGEKTAKLRRKIDSIAQKYKATIGVAIISIEARDTMTVNATHHFPMQSVFKFPLAMKVLSEVDKGKFSLGQKLHLAKEDLHPNTYSPLRDKYPDGNVDVSLSEILGYTVSHSDNNGCDFLFGLVGGPVKVNDYIHSIGIKDINIVATEYQMAQAWDVQYTNWSIPFAMAQLLEQLYHKKDLSAKSNAFLMDLMEQTQTGPKRIRGLLPKGTVVADKTGTSDKNDKGMRAATNDVGIITLPNGSMWL